MGGRGSSAAPAPTRDTLSDRVAASGRSLLPHCQADLVLEVCRLPRRSARLLMSSTRCPLSNVRLSGAIRCRDARRRRLDRHLTAPDAPRGDAFAPRALRDLEDERTRRVHARSEADARPPPAERLLALQRTAGNQAVARALKGRRRIDRLVGFEAELSVPSMPAPGGVGALLNSQPGPEGGVPTANIEAFLRGGLPYGASRAASTRDAQLPAEGRSQRTPRAARGDPDQAHQHGLFPAGPARVDEQPGVRHCPGGRVRAQFHHSLSHEILDAVKVHANALFPAVGSQMSQIGAPAGARSPAVSRRPTPAVARHALPRDQARDRRL